MRINSVRIELRGSLEEVGLGLLRRQSLKLGLMDLEGLLLDRISLLQHQPVLGYVVALVDLRIVVPQLACRKSRKREK